jgi:hypothetical protein
VRSTARTFLSNSQHHACLACLACHQLTISFCQIQHNIPPPPGRTGKVHLYTPRSRDPESGRQRMRCRVLHINTIAATQSSICQRGGGGYLDHLSFFVFFFLFSLAFPFAVCIPSTLEDNNPAQVQQQPEQRSQSVHTALPNTPKPSIVIAASLSLSFLLFFPCSNVKERRKTEIY